MTISILSISVPNIVFIILIAIMTGILTFLTAKGKLMDDRFKKNFLKRFTKRGRFVILILILMLILLALQEINNNVIIRNQNRLLKKEQLSRDSIIAERVRIGVDNSSKKLFDDVSLAFKNQGLILDTVRKRVEKLIDSSKTTINYVNPLAPVLSIDTNGIIVKNKASLTTQYDVTFRSHDAASTKFDISCHLLVEYSDSSFANLGKLDLFPKDLKISKDGKWTVGVNMSTEKPLKYTYIYLFGTYTNLDNTNEYKIDDLYIYNIEKNVVGITLAPHRKRVLDNINSF